MVYKGWDEKILGPPPVWTPSIEEARKTNLGRFMAKHSTVLLGSEFSDPIKSYRSLQNFSVDYPEVFWPLVFSELNVTYFSPPSCILDTTSSIPGGEWLPNALLNAAQLCLWPSLDGKRNDKNTAIIWRREGTKNLNRVSLRELRERACIVANALEALGFGVGDPIAIDMPMNVESIVIYLGVVMSGCVVVSIADSFMAHEIEVRLDISKTKAIFTQDVIERGNQTFPLYSRVIEARAPLAVVVPSHGSTLKTKLREGDISWKSFLDLTEKLERPFEYSPRPLPSSSPSNILFSSGTTGTPKAIVWSHVTPLKPASDAWALHDTCEGDVLTWHSSIGWMMGPWLIYGALVNGGTMGIFEGRPTGREFAEFVQDAKVTMLGVIPSLVRAWRGSDAVKGLDWSSIRCFSSTGEASSFSDSLWLMGRTIPYRPIIEYCGGTEIGGAFIASCPLLTQGGSCFSTETMGTRMVLLDAEGREVEGENVSGEVALLPSLLGGSTYLLNTDHHKVYFQGMPKYKKWNLRRHGDEFERLVGGFFRARGRVDDTMNLGGIKVSSVEIERVCNISHESIEETAAIGVSPIGGGPESLIVFVVLKGDSQISPEKLKIAMSKAIQSKLNPLFKIYSVSIVPKLPRTASNKVMRRVLRNQYQSKIESQPSDQKSLKAKL